MIRSYIEIPLGDPPIWKFQTQPTVPMKKKKRTDEPKWLDAELRAKIRTKRQAWSEWKQTGRETECTAYKKAKRESKRMIRNKKNALERNIAKNRTSNPKMYYSLEWVPEQEIFCGL